MSGSVGGSEIDAHAHLHDVRFMVLEEVQSTSHSSSNILMDWPVLKEALLVAFGETKLYLSRRHIDGG